MPATYVKKDGTVSVYDKKRYNDTYHAKYAGGHFCMTCNRYMNHSQIRRHEETTLHKKRAAMANRETGESDAQ